ncbi:GNAT family N-acetyltransferase [Danxiaibacter flavus]|uniref:GNAT family N-acetyltransferase n=1 Tax=Danxiaibacter flavus TaxID=3049108 RepID=A0ABV3ZBX0_9BACT|nr:GNAT family N-acetyltransferase [Chitinophagaceae bacterium DXS]
MRHYVETIWGWDEEFQLAFHRDNYRPEDTFIIKVEDKSAGTVEVREDEEKIFICSLYIHPDYQGKSIGTSMIKDYLASADLQRKRTDLEVLRLNTRALELYKRLGFVEIIEKGDEVKHYLSRPFDNM